MFTVCLLSSQLGAQTMRLKVFQEAQVRQDSPLSQLQWLDSLETMLFMGTKYLWIWDLQDRRLNRIPKPAGGGQTFVGYQDDHIWLAQDRSLIKIHGETFASKVYSIPSRSAIIGLGFGTKQLRLASSEAIIIFDTDSSRFMESQSFAGEGPVHFWNNELWSLSEGLSHYSDGSWNRLLHCPEGPSEPMTDGRSLYYQCQDKLYRFIAGGQLIQLVHNRSREAVRAWSMNSREHSFLFEHQVLEVYKLADKSLKSYKVPVAYQEFRLVDGVLLGITEGFPVISRLPEPSYQRSY